jgi:hypothetical protein
MRHDIERRIHRPAPFLCVFVAGKTSLSLHNPIPILLDKAKGGADKAAAGEGNVLAGYAAAITEAKNNMHRPPGSGAACFVAHEARLERAEQLEPPVSTGACVFSKVTDKVSPATFL